MRSRPRLRLCVGAFAGGLVAAWAPPAPAASLDLSYDALVLGFPALSLAFRLEQGASAYHILGNAHTNGVANLVVSYHLDTHTDGQIVAGRLQPSAQASHSKRNGDERFASLQYKGAAVHAELTPAPPKPLSAEEIAGTLDPASAALTAGRTLASSGRCDQRIKVFDGRRRYDLVLADDGEERLERGFSSYSGPAHRCQVTLIKIDEALHEEVETKSGPAVAWFASLDPALPPLPVQIDFESRWGKATVALTAAKPVTSAAAKP